MSDASGKLTGTIKYTPFGLTFSISGTLPTDKRYTGQREDNTTGIYYYGARYYDPLIGRFISPDTEGIDYNNPQSLNRYTYCLNNPLTNIDPTGHWSWKSFFKKAAIVVGAVVLTAALIVAAPVVLTAVATTVTAIASSTTVAAVTTTAVTVAATATTWATAIAPLANRVASMPVLGPTATAVASVGLESVGIGNLPIGKMPNTPPSSLNHYTNVGPEVILKKGINAASGINYATNLGT